MRKCKQCGNEIQKRKRGKNGGDWTPTTYCSEECRLTYRKANNRMTWSWKELRKKNIDNTPPPS